METFAYLHSISINSTFKKGGAKSTFKKGGAKLETNIKMFDSTLLLKKVEQKFGSTSTFQKSRAKVWLHLSQRWKKLIMKISLKRIL
jgi:hypothetical protein